MIGDLNSLPAELLKLFLFMFNLYESFLSFISLLIIIAEICLNLMILCMCLKLAESLDNFTRPHNPRKNKHGRNQHLVLSVLGYRFGNLVKINVTPAGRAFRTSGVSHFLLGF